MQRFLVCLVLILIVSVISAGADETMDEIAFGSCHAFTSIDDFTDELSHFAVCEAEGESLGDYRAIVACTPSGAGAAFQAGIQLIWEDTVKVRYRFDRGEVFSGIWNWSSDSNMASDFSSSGMDTATAMLEGIRSASRFVFEVGDEKGVADLTSADGPGVVDEILERCGWELATNEG